MQAQMKQWSDLNQSVLASAQKLADINTNLLMNLAQRQMDMVGIWVETGNKQVQALSQAERVQDVVATESQLVEEFNKKVLNNFRVTVDMLVESKNQLTEWAEDGMKQAAEWNPWLQSTKSQ